MSTSIPSPTASAPALAAGVDLGGTKIETQIFDANWQVLQKNRAATPRDYSGLINAIGDMFDWIAAQAPDLPVGIAAAGLIHKNTGLALSSNLPATGKTFVRDVAEKIGHDVHFINDCRAFTLSESIFGAARGMNPVVGVILGTGVGGGVVVHEKTVLGADDLSGEFGHFAAPAALVVKHQLPIIPCGCGRLGCIETLISGPGMARLSKAISGREMTSYQVASERKTDKNVAKVWAVWCDLVGELFLSLTLTIDPKVIVLGGGLSRISGVAPDLQAALVRAQFKGFPVPEIRLAEGGDASGARGAAFSAWQGAQND